MTANLVDRLLTAISPWRCVLCRGTAHGMDICADCINDLPWLGRSCHQCALPLTSTGALLCGACIRAPTDIDHCIAALVYEYPVDRLVTGLKYRRNLAYARVLGELLAIRISEALASGGLEKPALLIPVPMHRWRQALRTYNQAEQIACRLGYDLSVPVETTQVLRVRNTPPQTSLSRAVRLRNLSGAFRVRGNVAGRRIALVDDVITTASTVRELARILKNKGAAEVQVWAVARTNN
ncbi:MAG: hypothetical protein CL799_05490 [Chromatiales bacterium]|jgi:ComF family protein|nr:hypothetical protein [Chromatiales bacterium]MDP6149812.1 ComF family protein [Gammaproteobacteria bacterium]MDP7093361.1 ComF family protein [Gammaproteobacteria bacterium]MDP7271037.1 ComF family protein [Gammaproteobacteria bacterium]HJP04177.1 ComF family protein [Gammaproteobacteria bacterium]